MSSPVFVRDAQGTPLMPTSAAYARRLIEGGKARWVPHHAFSVLQLTQAVAQPTLRPVVVGVIVHLHTAELLLLADGEHSSFPLLHVVVDLRTDLPIRIRRRAGHRRRRRARGRYRSPRPYGVSFKIRRPSMHRSRWRSLLRPRKKAHRAVRVYTSPTIHWRAQAIVRVIASLRLLTPISHLVILAPFNTVEPYDAQRSPTILRQQLIDAYGQIIADGQHVAMCAYCGTTKGRIEAEHILPVSRGGTDGWNNRVLACSLCNARKGDRTPEEAGMPLQIQLLAKPMQINQAGVYARRTARLLVEQCVQGGLSATWRRSPDDIPAGISQQLFAGMMAQASDPSTLHAIVAKPIAHAVKQVFSAHNYQLKTPLRPGFVRIGQTIKRRIQVNRAMVLQGPLGHRRVRVIPADMPIPENAELVIQQGMFCEAKRSGREVAGIVAAIHSAGRLTLLVPNEFRRDSVTWQRITVSPRKHLRIISTEHVIFLEPAHLLPVSLEKNKG